ncbi:MAG: class I SAM-dependent methyltransferase, partial [Nanoarchaeota archaeon]|nr:class I SAM-dependent methyltransferase [Nanoarchaeota archaeon]
ILIQIKGSEKNIMWQKERLLNIGLKHLPKDCDKIAWLDCDIIFENDDWIKETSKLLEKYIVVQPFDWVVRLSKKVNSIKLEKSNMGYNSGEKFYGISYGVSHFGKKILSKHMEHGLSGYAWTARKEIFDSLEFYDNLILGGGDLLMAQAFYGDPTNFIEQFFSEKFKLAKNQWMNRIFKEVKGSVSHLSGTITHLWHGEKKNRFYGERKEIDFDPEKDIELDENNCWKWKNNNTQLQNKIKKYFWLRNEEDFFFRKIYSIFSASKLFKKNLYNEENVEDKPLPFGHYNYNITQELNNWGNKKVSEIVKGKTFADVGGLFGIIKERVSVAYKAGATYTTMIDMCKKNADLWKQFDIRCKKLKVKCNKKIVANIDDSDFVKKIGQYDVVSCSGVLYHCPNPIHTLLQLAKITKQYLILGTTIIPQKLENKKGELFTQQNSCLFVPGLTDYQKGVINEYFKKVALKDIIQKDSDWSLGNYSLWWNLFTKEYVETILKICGFEILESSPEWGGRSVYFLAKKSKLKNEK